MLILSTLLISLFITMALIPILRSLAKRVGNGLDFPNERKVHARPIPKVGGLAMALGALLPLLVLVEGNRFASSLLLGAGIIVVFGLIDDVRNLAWKWKFIGQATAALVVIFWGGIKICFLGECLPQGILLPALIAVPLTVLVVVGVTNAINLSDGLDGLAGGSSMIIFICIAYLAYTGSGNSDSRFMLFLSIAVIGAIFGFLRYNTYPATVFMGDTGSQLLGFLAITLTLGLTQGNTPLSPFLPLLLLGFPVLDTLTVMVERIAKGRSPFEADQNHFHHKLMRLGLYHTEAVAAIYVITVLLVAVGFLLRFYSDWLIITIFGIFAGLVIAGFHLAGRTGWQMKRTGVFDRVIKGNLKVLKDKRVVIRTSFQLAGYFLMTLLLISSLMPQSIPIYFALVCMVMIITVAIVWILKKQWLTGALAVAFYPTLPFLLRIGQVDTAGWLSPISLRVYGVALGLLAMFLVLTVKFTERQRGFKATPMDMLIVLIALVVPNLPDPLIQSYHMGFLATSIIVMYFSFEVLVGELRGQLTKLGLGILLAMVIITVRGFSGI